MDSHPLLTYSLSFGVYSSVMSTHLTSIISEVRAMLSKIKTIDVRYAVRYAKLGPLSRFGEFPAAQFNQR